MFTGLVAGTGIVAKLVKENAILRISIKIKKMLSQSWENGDSIAVNGICLTVVNRVDDTLDFQAVGESYSRTTLPFWVVGTEVNLEPALKINGRLDGHFVSGHVDDIGEVIRVQTEGDAKRIYVQTNNKLLKFIAEKGSVALDGMSLTVASINREEGFSVVLIPYTLRNTIWHSIQTGRKINIEVDILARYVERLLAAGKSGDGLTLERLIESGF